MTKTLVATDKYIDPLWQDWSRQVAYAESLPVGSDAEEQAWAKADELYAKWQTAVNAAAQLDAHYESMASADLDATHAAASNRWGW